MTSAYWAANSAIANGAAKLAPRQRRRGGGARRRQGGRQTLRNPALARQRSRSTSIACARAARAAACRQLLPLSAALPSCAQNAGATLGRRQ